MIGVLFCAPGECETFLFRLTSLLRNTKRKEKCFLACELSTPAKTRTQGSHEPRLFLNWGRIYTGAWLAATELIGH